VFGKEDGGVFGRRVTVNFTHLMQAKGLAQEISYGID
jgi:hypothetical protein